MLTEELRPKKLDDVCGQELNIKIIKGFIKKEKLPHMLFSGPAGTGKTSTAECIARELYGDEWREYYIEQNASDDRGIGVVRDKIKREAEISTLDFPFKIYFLDECDALTKEAQDALRRIIEKNTDRTVFILSCNYKNKLIEPLINRCVYFPFKPLNKKDISEYIKGIAEQYNIHIQPVALEMLASISKGSIRPVLNTFEKFIATDQKEITPNIVSNYTNQITEKDIQNIMSMISDRDVTPIDNYIENVIIGNGYEPAEVLEKIREFIKKTKMLSDKQKLMIIKLLGDIDFRIAQGATPAIQLKTFFAYIIMQIGK